MSEVLRLVEPRFVPPLDPGFRPAVLANHAFLKEVRTTRDVPLVFALERADGSVSRYETRAFADGDHRAAENLWYAERLLKFLLWQRGGWRVYIAGPSSICAYLAGVYSTSGAREFDQRFMGEDVYERKFEIVACADPSDVPREKETTRPLGRHLKGCRIGFDLGASDRKVSAVIDGEAIFSEEVIWEPRKHDNPEYHYREIMTALRTAASKMPRLDAIGGSSAGVIINSRIMVASLFRAVPKDRFQEVHDLFPRIRREMGVPLEVVNDGEVTALAGSMSLEDNGVLGVALGSSEAGGYVTMDGNITGWLNELAFCPVDYSPEAPMDEWSHDRGVGSQYFSQQCVFRLAPKAGIDIPTEITDAEKLKLVQEKLESGHEGARKIWQSIGYYMGYAVAHYADFYQLKHVLILGRCTSGSGGQIILDGAGEVLNGEFPELAARVKIQLPDEKSRRVGQSIAAASLPE